MSELILKRILISIFTILATSLIIFLILTLAPGDPLGEFAANPAITEQVRENIRKSLGLDEPIYIRYFKWLFAFIRGDMGYSFTSLSPVFNLILQRLPATLIVVGTAYFLSVLVAVPLGIIAAINRYNFIDKILSVFSLLGYSLPVFITGLTAIIVFSVVLNWLPSSYSSTLEVRDFSSFIELIKQSIMPVCVLTLYQTAVLQRFTRSSVIDEIPQEYVKTAYAKGLDDFEVLKTHIVRNALIPVITLIALDIPSIFTGALVTEQVFNVPGIGALLVNSIARSDTPVVMGITFIYAILIVIFNLIADLTYGFLDPRVKTSKK